MNKTRRKKLQEASNIIQEVLEEESEARDSTPKKFECTPATEKMDDIIERLEGILYHLDIILEN